MDPAQLRAWWPSPIIESNVGVVVGEQAGVFVVDLDRHTEVEDGVEAFQDVLSETGLPWPETPMQLTGGGGIQVFFHHPGGRVASRTGRDAIRPGLEIKGDGSYVVVPPSVHGSGKTYTWDAGYSPVGPNAIAPIACPPPLLDALGVTPMKRARDRSLQPVRGVRDTLLVAAFGAAGWLGAELGGGRFLVRCPWADTHSDGRGDGFDSSAVLLPATRLPPIGGFHCAHAHCANRSLEDVLRALPRDALDKAVKMFPLAAARARKIRRAR